MNTDTLALLLIFFGIYPIFWDDNDDEEFEYFSNSKS